MNIGLSIPLSTFFSQLLYTFDILYALPIVKRPHNDHHDDDVQKRLSWIPALTLRLFRLLRFELEQFLFFCFRTTYFWFKKISFQLQRTHTSQIHDQKYSDKRVVIFRYHCGSVPTADVSTNLSSLARVAMEVDTSKRKVCWIRSNFIKIKWYHF